MNLLGRLQQWFRKEREGTDVFNPAQFERLCLENPAAAHQALASDQRELAMEFEKTYGLYQKKMEELAERLSSLPSHEIRREAGALREAQDGLRRILRRIETSAMASRELEAELQEWETRKGEEGPRHADHPEVRAEILRSELAARGHEREPQAIGPECSPFTQSIPLSQYPELPLQDFDDEEEAEEAGTKFHPDPEQLLQIIKMETREAERWHGHPQPDGEALVQVRHMKELHGILKRLDRERGIRRDRMTFAVRME